MEWFDIVDEDGRPTGETVSRETAHREGIPHRSAHVWIVRRRERGMEVLLQKRSRNKDSYPGQYDTSSAGHIQAGDEPLPSALRELQEELGISVMPEALQYLGTFRQRYTAVFHGREFSDNEIAFVYACALDIETSALSLQAEEVEAAEWFLLDAVIDSLLMKDPRFCVPMENLLLLQRALLMHRL